MNDLSGTLVHTDSRFTVRRVGKSSFYVHWTRKRERLMNGWFHSLADAISWGKRHV